MSDLLKVTVCEGKYTVVQHADGSTEALRCGESWRNTTGDGLILALAQRVEELSDLIQRAPELTGSACAGPL